MIDYQKIIDKYYPEGTRLRDILIVHSRRVADKALCIYDSLSEEMRCEVPQRDVVEAAAMLHDIGICKCDAVGIECYGTEPYICHGTIGAKLLRDDAVEWGIGVDEIELYARVCERHTGAGLTADDIKRQNLPLPERDLMPETMMEKLICYADKFFSKTHPEKEKALEKVRRSMQKFGEASQQRFEHLHELFSL